MSPRKGRKRRQRRREARRHRRAGGPRTQGGPPAAQPRGDAGPAGPSAAPPRRDVEQGGQTAMPTRYRMREQLLAIGDDFVIETAAGQPAFRVDGKALRVRDTIQIRDREGTPLYRIQERKLRLRDTMVIERDGQRVATINKALVTPLRDRFDVQVEGGPPLSVQGNVFDHEYAITRDGLQVATVSRRYFRVRDTYGVEVAPGEDDAFVLAVVAAIDELREPER